MFEATCHQFCQSVGRDTLVPVRNLDIADNVQPLQVVVKTVKRHYIFWEKAKYRPTEYKLAQLLTDTSALDVPVEQKFLLNYNRTTKFSLDGKFGAKFLDELMDVNLEAADSVSVSAKLGDITKLETNVPTLQEKLQQRKVNLSHDFVRQIRQDKKKVLCVIKSVAELADTASLSKSINQHGSVSIDEKLLESAEVGTNIEYDRGRDMVLPKKTPIAYSLSELQVSTVDGAIEVILGQGLHGGFRKTVGFDQPDTTVGHAISNQEKKLFSNDTLLHVQTILRPIISLPKEQRQKLTDSLLHLLPCLDDIYILCHMLDQADLHGDYQAALGDLERKLVTRRDVWMEILNMAGFSVNDKGVLSLSREKGAELDALGYVFDALEELETDELNLIRNCRPENTHTLLCVLDQALQGTKAILESTETSALLSDNAARKLLLHLGFSIQSQIVTPPSTLPVTMDEVYWILCALWGSFE
ncbi:hypothetical protein ScPMuIL_017049 [Solemya velum]